MGMSMTARGLGITERVGRGKGRTEFLVEDREHMVSRIGDVDVAASRLGV